MPENTVRIIGGRWRGRKIHFPDAAGLRPTPDRVRETLFNWLMHDVVDANCLDAFAGSGALGLEVLSRGAKSVTFLEQQPKAYDALLKTINNIGCKQDCHISQTNCLNWLNHPAKQQFDIVFLDPPFHQDLLSKSLSLLTTHGWLKPTALIYLECESALQLQDFLTDNFEILKDKQAGEVRYGLLKYLTSGS